MEEYDTQIINMEKEGFESYAQSMDKLKEWSKTRDNQQYMRWYQFESQILKLVEKYPIIMNSNQPLLVDRITDMSPETVEGQQLDYYKRRLDITTLPFLKYLYANFLYDYSTSNNGLSKYPASEAIFASIKELLETPYNSALLLERYLQLSISMNNLKQERWLLEYICQEFGNLNVNAVTLCKCLKMLAYAKKSVRTTSEQDQKIFEILDDRIGELQSKKNFKEVRSYLKAKLTLMGIKSDEKPGDIYVAIGDSYVLETTEVTSKALKVISLENALRWFKDSGKKEKVFRVKVLLKNAYRDYDKSNEFTNIHVESALPDEEQQHYDKWIKSIRDMDITEILKALTHTRAFIPNRSEILNSAKETLENNPLMSIVPKVIINDNRKIATYTTDDEQVEYEFNKTYEYTLKGNMLFYLRPIFMLKEESGELDADVFIDFLRDSKRIDTRNLPIISIGVERYFQNDYVSAIHILAPQFESTLRRMFENAGYPTTSLGTDLIQKEQTFNAFLERDDVKKALGDNVQQIIKLIMVENVGLNLRNDIGHGLLPLEKMTKENCLFILYLFLIISGYIVKEESD